MPLPATTQTGTLTLNRLTLDKADIQAWGSTTPDHVLLMASLSAKWTNQVNSMLLCWDLTEYLVSCCLAPWAGVRAGGWR